jgi:hypothetical protein
MQTADSIDLLGTLQLHAGASRAVTTTTTYLNDLLITGAASDQLLAAMPQLTSADGYVAAAAVATLHPEAYAAASQIGMDNGLAIFSALRSTQRAGEGAHRGLFTLGQGLGGWQTMRGNAAAGTANARDNTGGFLGGIGYQAGKVAFAAFAGRLYANQTLPTRAASTRANGTFVGGMVSFANRGLDLGGSVTWDDSSATTRRTLFDASTVTGDYALHTLTLDAHGGYGFALGRGGWRIGPELGVTHIRVKRGEARETGIAVRARRGRPQAAGDVPERRRAPRHGGFGPAAAMADGWLAASPGRQCHACHGQSVGCRRAVHGRRRPARPRLCPDRRRLRLDGDPRRDPLRAGQFRRHERLWHDKRNGRHPPRFLRRPWRRTGHCMQGLPARNGRFADGWNARKGMPIDEPGQFLDRGWWSAHGPAQGG